MKRASGICLVLLLAALPLHARTDRVDDVVRTEMRRQSIPGLSIAVVRNGRVVKVQGYGRANIECNVPVKRDTIFQIQSVTKSFTAAGILMLVEEDKVGLDDPVSRHLDGSAEAWRNLTVRHLLTHTSGLKDYINEPTQSLCLDITDDEVLKAAAARPMNFTPGTRYQYSNTNYLLLGMLIRKVTGKGYGDFLTERVFRPLGMDQTRIYSWSEIIPNRAAGYLRSGSVWSNGEYIAPKVLAYPGGGILSTARDLAKWDIALSEGRILRDGTRRQMWAPARLNDGTESHYGFGWDMGSIAGHPYQNHNGGHSTGFSSSIIRFPQDHLSVIVLSNVAGADTFRLAQCIAGQYVPDLTPKNQVR